MHQQYFRDHVGMINQALESYLTQRSQGLQQDYAKLMPLIHQFIVANEGGKRLRAVLVMMGYEMIMGHRNDDVISVALAYELFQTSILAHDDIIDMSDLRRGRPTLHKAVEGRGYHDLQLSSAKGPHYGISHSICLADIGLFLASKVIVDSKLSDDIKVKASQSFLQSCIDTGLGEILDVELSYVDRKTITESDIISVYRDKTAHYTITGPLSLGAMCAGADDETLKAIEQFSTNLGIAFQIKDDLIGIYQEESVSGKSATSDIVEGKYTLLYHHALQQIDLYPDLVHELQSLYGTAVTQEQYHRIKELFIMIGSKEYSESIIESYVQSALTYIPYLTPHPAYREYLHQFASFMINRTN